MECNLHFTGNISRFAFHNLSSHCESDSISDHLEFPSNFFIQLIRFSVGICVIVVLLAVYNSISVMNKHILSTAACSLYWVFMTLMIVLKSSVLTLFPILAVKNTTSTHPSSSHLSSLTFDPDLSYEEKVQESLGEEPSMMGFNMAGFVLQAVFQSLAVLFLFCALDHEYRFRSSDYATVDTPTKHCMAMSCSCRMFCSIPRVIALVLTALPLVLLVVIEVMLEQHHDHTMHPYLFWAYVASLPLTRLACLAMGVALLLRRRDDKLSPTVMAKVFLMIGLVLSLMEDFPNSVTSCHASNCDLNRMSVFDLLQLLGIFSLLSFVFFVRSQYLRVEQESKLSLVWDLQKLLQVNGRKDIIRHYNT